MDREDERKREEERKREREGRGQGRRRWERGEDRRDGGYGRATEGM